MKHKASICFASLFLIILLLGGCLLVASPQYTIDGIVDGGEYSTPVTIVVNTGNKHTRLELFLNDEPFTNGSEVFMPGSYELRVVASNGKQEVVDVYTFTIEHDLPIISITGVKNEGYYHEPVTPTITTDGENDELEITLNGEPFESGTTIDEDGIYTLEVIATRPPDTGTSRLTYTFEVRLGVPAVHYFRINPKSETDLTPVGFSADRATLTVNTVMVPPGDQYRTTAK